MKNHFINCLYFTAAFLFLSGTTAYSQQFETHEDHIYINPHVSGVGSSVIVYHLSDPIETTVLAELENYMKSFKAITDVDVNGQDISIQFRNATTNQMISTLIQRMEMLYIHKNPKSK